MDMGLPNGLERATGGRGLAPSERKRFEGYLSGILGALGMDLTHEGTRGVHESEAHADTLAWRGDYEASEALRREFLALAAPR